MFITKHPGRGRGEANPNPLAHSPCPYLLSRVNGYEGLTVFVLFGQPALPHMMKAPNGLSMDVYQEHGVPPTPGQGDALCAFKPSNHGAQVKVLRGLKNN